MGYFLGLDAGNTKTIAVICATDGTVCGYGRSGCGDLYGAGSPQAAIMEIGKAVLEALRMAGITEKDLLAGGFSMAGVDWPEDYESMKTGVREKGWGRRTVVWNDALGGLRAGSPDGYGVGIILGTGPAIGAMGHNGEVWHCSFWAQDLNSTDLTRSTYKAVFQAELGIAQSTSLTNRILEISGKPNVTGVLHSLTARKSGPNPSISKIVGALVDEAEKGDPAALGIIQKYCEEYVNYAAVAANRVKFGADEPFYLVLSGGLLKQSSSFFRDQIAKRFLVRFPSAVPVTHSLEPVVGAVYWAYEAHGSPITSAASENLIQTMPNIGFFSTA